MVRKAGDEASRLRFRLFRADVLSQAGKRAEAEAECLALLKEYNTAGDVREVRLALLRPGDLSELSEKQRSFTRKP